MSSVQPKDLFLEEGIAKDDPLRFERVLGEPKTKCLRCEAELILSRLLWQSHCHRRHTPWNAQAIFLATILRSCP